jgi:hypothetical protein
MRFNSGCWLGLVLASAVTQAQNAHGYTNSFEGVEIGKVPADMLVLDGAFAVREEGGNRFLELPGSPLDTYGVLFGAAGGGDVAVSARCFGTAVGRRYPTFAVACGGVAGYRLQVSPGKGRIELFRGDDGRASAAYRWVPGRWTWLKLRVLKAGGGCWRVEGKAWGEGSPEPTDWLVGFEETETPKPGRAGLFGAPFSGTPIRFDDVASEAGAGP